MVFNDDYAFKCTKVGQDKKKLKNVGQINYDIHDNQSASYSLRLSVTVNQIKSHAFCDDPVGLILSRN